MYCISLAIIKLLYVCVCVCVVHDLLTVAVHSMYVWIDWQTDAQTPSSLGSFFKRVVVLFYTQTDAVVIILCVFGLVSGLIFWSSFSALFRSTKAVTVDLFRQSNLKRKQQHQTKHTHSTWPVTSLLTLSLTQHQLSNKQTNNIHVTTSQQQYQPTN